MYVQIFLVTSVRGIGLPPITAESDASGCIAFMNAAFGLRFDAVFFFAGAFLLAFFFAAIPCLPLSLVVGWILRGLAARLRSTVTRGCRGKTPLSMIAARRYESDSWLRSPSDTTFVSRVDGEHNTGV